MRRLKAWSVPILCFGIQGSLAWRVWDPQLLFAKYPDAARMALDGSLPAERLADLSPLYYWLHLLVAWLPFDGLPWLVGLQLMFTALAAGMLHVLLRQVVSRPVAWVGTGAFIFSRSVVIHACLLEPEALLLFCLLGFAWCAYRPGRNGALAAGVFLALCLLIRPSTLPLLLLGFFWLLLRDGYREGLRRGLWFVVMPVVALLVLSIRNVSIGSNFSPVVMNPGYVFFEGNNPLSSGRSAVYPPLIGEMKTELPGVFDNPHVTYRELAQRVSGRSITIGEVNGYWAQLAFNFIADNPGVFISKLAWKGFCLVHAAPRHDLSSAWVLERRLAELPLPNVPVSLLTLCAGFGLVAVRRQWRLWFLPAMILLTQASVMLLLYVSERQRLPLLPFAILFAALGVDILRTVRPRLRIFAVIVFGSGTILLNLPVARIQDDNHLWQRFAASDLAWAQALQARKSGDWEGARERAAASLGYAPWLKDYARPAYIPFGADAQAFARAALDWRQRELVDRDPSDQFDLAQLLLTAGQVPEAKQLFFALQRQGAVFDRGYLQSSSPGYYLAIIEIRSGNRQAAIDTASRALAEYPGDPFLLALLARLTNDRNYAARLERYFGRADTAMLLGLADCSVGNPGSAAGYFREVVRVLPELRRARLYLAAAEGRSGHDDAAVRGYLAATAERVDPVVLEEAFLPVVRRWQLAEPEAAERQFVLGQVLAEYGHLQEAQRWQRRAVQTRSGYLPWAESLRAVDRMRDDQLRALPDQR